MALFPHREARYYTFGLRAGVANFLSNRFLLGARKTIGKITQPINAYSRFPEYYWFDLAVRRHLLTMPSGARSKIPGMRAASPATARLPARNSR